MKNIFRNILFGTLLATMLGACDLDMIPTTSIVFDEDEPILRSENDIKSFYNGVMASYRAVQYGAFTQSTEVMCDGFNAVIGFGNNYGSIHRTDDSFTTSDEYAENMWGSHYSAIKNYNIAIEQADYVDSSLVALANELKGVALFCRASSYLTLVRHFGKDYDPDTASSDLAVPLVLVYDQYERPSRATVEEVYDQIIIDLDDAEYYLSETGAYGGMIRAAVPTLDAINALKARYFLDIHEYKDAAKAAESVLASAAGYELANSSRTMQSEYIYDEGTEPIVQLFASLAEGLVGNTIFTQVSKDREGKYFQPYYIPSATLVNAYDTGDLRLSNWFSKGLYPIFTNGTRYNGIYTFTKYYDNPNLRAGSIETGAHAAKPLMIGEMYLIAAEAYAMDGNAGKAKGVLNELQEARGAAQTSGTMDFIKKEWFKETVGEGLRLSCLKRWGDGINGRPAQAAAASIVMTGQYYDQRVIDADDYVMTWPVPSYELKLNDNLIQNDGYDAE